MKIIHAIYNFSDFPLNEKSVRFFLDSEILVTLKSKSKSKFILNLVLKALIT